MRSRALWQTSVVVLLAWGVLALGGARPWGYAPLFAGVTLYGLAAFLAPAPGGAPGRALVASLGVLGGAVLLQLVPLPASALAALSPARMAMAGGPDSASSAWALGVPLSTNPPKTAIGLASLGALGVFFLALVRTMGSDGAKRLAIGLIGIGTIVALVGMAEASTAWGRVYTSTWEALRPESTPRGPFANRNHYAGFLLMTTSLAAGYLGVLLERVGQAGRDSTRRLAARLGWSGRLAAVQAAAMLMAVALVQTRSRAGILCLAAGIALMSGGVVLRRVSLARRLAVAASLILLLLTGVAVAGVGSVADRFAASSWATANGRLPIWRQAASIVADFPLTGSGFNTYQTIAPRYTTPELDEAYEAAHNDYLQVAAEGGLLVGVPALAVIGCLVAEIRTRFRESAASGTDWLRAGAVVGLTLVAMQEAVDFSLQMPANAALAVVLAAIAVHREDSESRHA